MSSIRLILCVLIMFVPVLAHADAINWANGYWGLNDIDMDAQFAERNCKDSPVHIRIDAENLAYWSQIGDQTPREGIISNVTDQGFTLVYDNEERRMTDGRLHIWHITFVDQDTFYWVRDDWKVKGLRNRTNKRYRCMLQIS